MARKNTDPTPLDGGNLTQEQALAALSAAAAAATNTLPDALLKSEDHETRQRALGERDACQLAYTSALARSLRHTGPLFEQAASELDKAARTIREKAKNCETAAEAVGLLADLARLSSKLALAFA